MARGDTSRPGETGRGGGARAGDCSNRAGGGDPWGGDGLRVRIGEWGESARGADMGTRGLVLVCLYDDIVAGSGNSELSPC